MAINYMVTATFVDHYGKKVVVKLVNPVGALNWTTMSDAKAFATAIAGYSRAGLVSYSSIGTEILDSYPDGFGVATTMAGEHYDTCAYKLIIYWRDKSSGKTFQTSIPAPADSCFKDNKVNTDIFTDMAQAIGKASNYTATNLNAKKAGLKKPKFGLEDVGFLAKTGV